MTNAVPFGVYITPASIIRADIRKHVSDGEWCYIQILKRMSDQSYSVLVASSYADLQRIYRDGDDSASESVFVSTITRQDLHRQCRLLFSPNVEGSLYVAPDYVLKGKVSRDGEDLQLFASSAWLCYFRVLRKFGDGSVRVRVAALPHRVDGTVGRSYFTILSRDEFALALQSERKDLDMATCDLRAKVEAKARAILRRPVEHIHPQVLLDDEDQEVSAPKQAYPPEVLKMLHPVPVELPISGLYDEEAMLSKAQGAATEKLKPVFIPSNIAKSAVQRFQENTGKTPASRKFEQKLWLQAALLALRFYKEQATRKEDKEAIDTQDQLIRSVLVNWLNNSVLLVEAVPVVKKMGTGKKKETIAYVVRIEQPVEA